DLPTSLGAVIAYSQENFMYARRLLVALAGLITFAAQAGTQTRTSAFAYDPASGLLIKEIIEPDNSELCVVTTYHYDAYGNRDKATTRNCGATPDPTGVSTSGEAGLPTGSPVFTTRTSTASYAAGSVTIGGASYTWSAGQFTTSSSNAFNQTETHIFDPRFGGVASLTCPKNLTTTWTFDSFGRKPSEARTDGTATNWFYERCADVAGACPALAQYRIRVTATGTATTSTYYDSLGREVRAETQGFDGTRIWADT